MRRSQNRLLSRTVWSPEQLEKDLAISVEDFRRSRLEEPLAAYLDAYDQVEDTIRLLLQGTANRADLERNVLELLGTPESLDAIRYLAAPPISLDDLKILVDTNSLSARRLRSEPELVERLVQTIQAGLDPRRFPWVIESREPTEKEQHAAIVASAVLMAAQRAETQRRSEGQQVQEDSVRQLLLSYGLTLTVIPRGTIGNLSQAPKPGEFCNEVQLGSAKADFVISLLDQRIMAIECKVSNSSTNSVKRLNHEAAGKAATWITEFGTLNLVPAAVLSGVFSLSNLLAAQERGLTIYWAHRLSDMTDWLDNLRSALA